MQSKNYLKITLFKVKVCGERDIGNFKLTMSMGQETYDTDKITSKEFEYGGKCFYIEIPNTLIPSALNIKAIGSSWMVFNSTLAEINIPFNHSSFNDQKQWYYLKNKSDENIICVLTSIFCDFSTLDNSTNLNITKNYINTKAEISYEANNQMMSMLNCTTEQKGNLTYNYGYNNYNSGSCDNDYNDPNNTIKNTHEYNSNGVYGSGQLFPANTSNNNILSPFSDRNNSCGNVLMENHDSIFMTIQSLLEQNQTEADPEVFERLRAKVNGLIEKEERIKQQQVKNGLALERIKQKESQLSKEKTILEDKIRKFKATQSDFEKKTSNLTQSSLLFENELANHIIDKEIYENSKENFFLLNYSLSSGQDITIVPINDLSSSGYTHLSKNVKIDMKKFNTKKENKKKEIVLENATKYLVMKPKRDSQSQSSSSSSNKITKQLNNTNIAPSTTLAIGTGLTNHNLNSTTINVSDINIELMKNSKKISPPVAQINLNYYDYQTPKNEKFIENRLLDSLETNYQGGIGACLGLGDGKHQKVDTLNENRLKKRNEGIAVIGTEKSKVKNSNHLQGTQVIGKQSKGNAMTGKSLDKMNTNIVMMNHNNNNNSSNNSNSNSNSNSTITNGHQLVNGSNGKRDSSINKNDIGASLHKFKRDSKIKG